MFKQFIALLVVSFLILIGASYAKTLMEYLWHAHTWTTDLLSHIFSGGDEGRLARDFIALIVVPMGLAAVPSFLYWVVRRSFLAFTMEIIWIIWLLQVGMLMANVK